MAVIPGLTATSISRHSGFPVSIASKTAAAIPNTPGSPPGLCKLQCVACAVDLFTIAALMAHLAVFARNALKIRAVSNKVAGIRNEIRGFGRKPGFSRRPEPDDPQAPPRAHGRLPWPGIKTDEK